MLVAVQEVLVLHEKPTKMEPKMTCKIDKIDPGGAQEPIFYNFYGVRGHVELDDKRNSQKLILNLEKKLEFGSPDDPAGGGIRPWGAGLSRYSPEPGPYLYSRYIYISIYASIQI